MAFVRIRFKSLSSREDEGILFYQITYDRMIRKVPTDMLLYREEWLPELQQAVVIGKDYTRKQYLDQCNETLKKDVLRFNRVLYSLSQKSTSFTVDDIIVSFKKLKEGDSFFSFMKTQIEQLKRMRKYRTTETYQTTMNSFYRFSEGHDIFLDEITEELLVNYECYLKDKGLRMNTISFYMRILRAVYNRAVENGLTEPNYPFKRVYTGIDKTLKRSVSIAVIQKIKDLVLEPGSPMDFARDMFLFSFYTRGMSFVDMAYLKKTNLRGNTLVYQRKKTGQTLFVHWEDCMQQIVEKYSRKSSVYLLPIICSPENERTQYKNRGAMINRWLKKIGILLKISTPLTMYVSRHSWASIAHKMDIPITVISEGMGHDSETTTKIYLSSIENEEIDEANKKILDVIKKE